MLLILYVVLLLLALCVISYIKYYTQKKDISNKINKVDRIDRIDRKNRIDRKISYESVDLTKIVSYTSFIKTQILDIDFCELYKTYYGDLLMRKDKVEFLLGHFMYGITISDKKIIPRSENYIPIMKTINQISKYYSSSYIMLDSTIKFIDTVKDICDKYKIYDKYLSDEKIISDENDSIKKNNIFFNDMSDYIAENIYNMSYKKYIIDISKYVDIYDRLCKTGFQVIDLNNSDFGSDVRLFTYIPTDLDMEAISSIDNSDTMSNISTYSTNVSRIDSIYSNRRSFKLISEISEKDDSTYHYNHYETLYKRIKIFYPMDEKEVEEILLYLDETEILRKNKTPVIMVQIKKIFDTYEYNGPAINKKIDIVYTYFKKYVSKSDTFRKIKSTYYAEVVEDAVKVFDFIKDSGMARLNTIDIHLTKIMTVLAPQIITKYENYDLKPEINFTLVDPMCYLFCFHKIYDSIKNFHNTKDDYVTRVKNNKNVMMMLDKLLIWDMYLPQDSLDHSLDHNLISPNLKTKKHSTKNNSTKKHPMMTENIRIRFTKDMLDKNNSNERFMNIMKTISKIRFDNRVNRQKNNENLIKN